MKITLVHSGDRLIEYLGKKASQKALKWLRNKKVEVILNDRYVGNYSYFGNLVRRTLAICFSVMAFLKYKI